LIVKLKTIIEKYRNKYEPDKSDQQSQGAPQPTQPEGPAPKPAADGSAGAENPPSGSAKTAPSGGSAGAAQKKVYAAHEKVRANEKKLAVVKAKKIEVRFLCNFFFSV